MTKKEKLQEEANSLEGYTDKLTIAQLEDLIAGQPEDTEPEPEPEQKKNETPEAPKEEKAEEEEKLTYSKETDRTRMRDYANKTRSNDDVKAALIKTVDKIGEVNTIEFEKSDSQEVPDEFIKKFDPRSGGYFVISPNGSKKYMRKYEFEELYYPKN